MPTYEYACKSCGKHFEVFQSFSDKPLKKHMDCGGDLQKVFHARGIVFKGSGFYATDSKASSSTKASDSTSESKPEKKVEKKTEKKTEAKASASSSSD